MKFNISQRPKIEVKDRNCVTDKFKR